MRTVLIQPPLDDPTMPYHAVAYLAGHLRAHGHPVAVRDLNVEFCDWSIQPETCARFLALADQRLAELTEKASTGFSEQEEAYLLARARGLDHEAPLGAVTALRNLEAFDDPSSYAAHQEVLRAHLQLMGALSYPASIRDFGLRESGRFSIFHLDDLLNEDLGGKACALFLEFMEQRIRADAEFRAADCFGVSLTYDHVLLPGIVLARFLRRAFPGRLVLLGGTAISRYLKNLGTDEAAGRVLGVCDGVVMGEGESALLRIIEAKGALGPDVPNLLAPGPDSQPRWPDRVHYEDVRTLKTPWYDFRWDLYFSPERAICYSPSRGCYWNRCTFCDYGLNQDSPTSPWRVRDVEQVVSDLENILDQTAAKFAYLAVDVLGAGYLERLAEAMTRRGVEVRWGAELRPEKAYTEERCRKLARSGLVAASLGIESGSQRVLDLIDKGVGVREASDAIRNFAAAGVAVQPMWFMGFPSETRAELSETFDFLRRHADDCSAQAFGHFTLTKGAIVAKEAARFGIAVSTVRDLEASDALEFRPCSPPATSEHDSLPSLTTFPDLPSVRRPWAGSVDSLHSLIMYSRHGRSVFKARLSDRSPAPATRGGATAEERVLLKGKLLKSSIDFGRIVGNRHLRHQYLHTLSLHALGATWGRFLEFEAAIRPTPLLSAPGYWVMDRERVLSIDLSTFEWLGALEERAGETSLRGRLGVERGDDLDRAIARLLAWGFLEVKSVAKDEG